MSSFDGLHHISINGVGLTVARSIRTNKLLYQRREAPTFVNKFSSGDPSYRDSSFYSHWVQLDWKNGGRQEFFNDAARFWSAQAINPTKESELRLARNAGDHSMISAATSTNLVINGLAARGASSQIYAAGSDGQVYGWTSATPWWQANFFHSWPVNDLIAVGEQATSAQYIVGATGQAGTSTDIYLLTGTGFGSWQDVVVDAGNLHPLTTLEEYNYYLYAGSSSPNAPATFYRAATSSLTQWYGVSQLPFFDNVNDMKSYGGFLFLCGGNTAGTGGKLIRYDGTYPATTTNVVRVVENTGVSFQQMEVYDNLLFVATNTGIIYVHNLSTFDKLFEIPGNPKINKMSIFNDELYIFTAANTGYSTIWKFDRNGFSEVTTLAGASTAGEARMGTNTFGGGILFANTSGSSAVIKLISGGTTEVYPTTGTNYVQSSYFDANLPSLDKIWHSLEVQYLSLPASVSVQCDYKTDDSDPSWTNLGTATSANTTRQTFLFPQGTFSKKLSYRVVLATSNSANTPKVKKVITKYVVKPDFYHLWNINIEASDNIQLVDGSYEVSTGSAIVTALSNIRRTKSLYEFRDFDYVSATISGTITSANTNIPLFQDPTSTNWPLTGRIRIPSISAEATYTSANTSALTGVAWNYKNTPFASAATSTLIDTSYMVLNNAINEESIWNDSPDVRYEQTVPIQLLET